MARLKEDFDEFCDPDKPLLIKHADVLAAAKRLESIILETPCIESFYQQKFNIKLNYKLEFLQKSGSFKERGSKNVLELMTRNMRKIGAVIASNGNEAAAFCEYAKELAVPVTVVMPVTVPISKLQKCHSFGAKVIVRGATLLESQKYARTIAREKSLSYYNCRDHPQILAGYGTVALEIVKQCPLVDAIIVPVGSGGLVAAVTRVIKQIKPNCLVYGVQPESTPGFYKSLEAGAVQLHEMKQTMADSIAVPEIGCNAFANAQPLLDKMLLVSEDWIARSIIHLAEKEKFIVEGAGACPLAAIIGSLVPELKLKTVVCILTGGNIDNISLTRCLDRGLSVEGRLVKFKVGIKNDQTSYPQLLRMLASGGYDLVNDFHNNVCTEDDAFTIEKTLVCKTNDLEHALELKRLVQRAYPFTSTFETEPFNDRRTCPCDIKKLLKKYDRF